jgi:hypothetical protein
MGIKYRAEFDDINAVRWKVDIDEASYSGSVNTFTVATPGFTATWEGDGSRVGENPIRSSKAVIHWLVSNSTEETFLDSLAQSSELKYNVLIYRAGTLWWVGTVLPDLCVFENRYYPFAFDLTAVDGLGRLEDFNFDYATNTSNPDEFTLGTIITEALKPTKLDTFYGGSDVYLRASCEWVDDNQDTVRDSLEKIRARRLAFLKNSDKADHSGLWEPITCKEALEKVLRSMGCRIEFSRGSYRIYQHQNYRDTSYTEYRYSKTGLTSAGYLTSQSISPRSGATWQSSDLALTTGAQYTYFPALRRAVVSAERRRAYDLGRSSFTSGIRTLNIDTLNTTLPQRITGRVYIQGTKAISRLKITWARWDTATSQYTDVVVRDTASPTNGPYDSNINLEWRSITPTSSVSNYHFGYNIPSNFLGNTSYRVPIDIDITIPPTILNIGGEIRITVTAEAWDYSYVNGKYVAGTLAWNQIAWQGSLMLEVMADTTNQEWTDAAEWESLNTAQADNSVAIELDNCLIDGNIQYTEGVEVNTTTPTWVAGTAWKRFSGDTLASVALPQLLANYILAHHWRPARILRGTFFDRPSFLFDCVNSPVYGSDVYVWNGGSFTANDARWNGEWVRYQFDGTAFTGSVKLPSNRDTVGTTEKDIKSLRQRVAELGVVAGGIVSRWIDGWLNQGEGQSDIGTPTGGDVWRPAIIFDTDDGFKAAIQPVFVFGKSVLDIATNTTLDKEARKIFVSTSGGNVTVTLPPASQFPEWETLTIIKTQSAHKVIIDGDGTETINGSTVLEMTGHYETATLVSYNANQWIRI